VIVRVSGPMTIAQAFKPGLTNNIETRAALAGGRLMTGTWYTHAMSTTAQDILEKFDRLPETDKHEVAVEILRRTPDINLPAGAFMGGPRLVNQDQFSDFEKEVIEEPHDARV